MPRQIKLKQPTPEVDRMLKQPVADVNRMPKPEAKKQFTPKLIPNKSYGKSDGIRYDVHENDIQRSPCEDDKKKGRDYLVTLGDGVNDFWNARRYEVLPKK